MCKKHQALKQQKRMMWIKQKDNEWNGRLNEEDGEQEIQEKLKAALKKEQYVLMRNK